MVTLEARASATTVLDYLVKNNPGPSQQGLRYVAIPDLNYDLPW